MSQIIATFDPSLFTTNTFALSELSNGEGTIIVWNESNWALSLEMPDGNVDLCPAWTASIYALNGPQGRVTWSQLEQLDSASPPISKVFVVAYQASESIPGTFPVALVRQTSIGNTVPISTSTNSVANDGNAAGTQFIESTVSGDTGSAVSVTNDGVIAIGTVAHPGSLTLKGTISTDNGSIVSNGAGQLTAASVKTNVAIDTSGTSWAAVTPGVVTRIANPVQVAIQVPGGVGVLSVISGRVNVGGDLVASGDLTSGGTINTTDAINDTSGTNWVAVTPGVVTRIANPAQVAIQVPGGSNSCTFDGTGMQVSSGNKIKFPVGSISAISKFTGTGSGTFNHGLGSTPDIIVCNPCSLSGSSQTIGFGNANATNVVVTTGAGLDWQALAIKF